MATDSLPFSIPVALVDMMSETYHIFRPSIQKEGDVPVLRHQYFLNSDDLALDNMFILGLGVGPREIN